MIQDWFLSRLTSALVAGSLAISLNTVVLKSADLIHLPTAHGGLLRLLSYYFSTPLQQSGIASIWSAVRAPTLATQTFQIGFHILVGLMMALFYALVLEPAIPWSTTVKGLVYLTGVWLVNALIVLPATGEGFAGSANLTLAGIAWFAAAHSIFFMLLAYGFAFLLRTRDRETHLGII
jgi:hypothetical protein